MKKIEFTPQMIEDIDKMPIKDFCRKYKISHNPVCKKRVELGIDNKGFFNRKIILENGIYKKWCPRCFTYLEFVLFSKDRSAVDELGAWCLECDRKRNRERNKTESNKKYQREYKKKRRDTEPKQKLFANIRRGITRFLKKKDSNFGKSKYEEIIGCTMEYLKDYLESLFRDGMSWENYGKVWHIDHILPQRYFDINSVKECWNYKNLQPLFIEDNLVKNDFLPDGSRAREIQHL